MADTSPFSITNILGGMLAPLKDWLWPIVIIVILLLILLIAKAIQKRAYEKNLASIKRN